MGNFKDMLLGLMSKQASKYGTIDEVREKFETDEEREERIKLYGNTSNGQKEIQEKQFQSLSEIREQGIRKSKRTILDNVLVFTGSGGTGVSTIVSNLAYKMSDIGLKVIVIDLNIENPIHHSYLGLRMNNEIQYDLVDVLRGQCSHKDALVVTKDKQYQVLFANNRDVMDKIFAEESNLGANLETLIQELRSYADVILIDTKMEVDNTLSNYAFYAASRIYDVWREGAGSILALKHFKRNLKAMGIEPNKIDVILNMRTSTQYSQDYFTMNKVDCISVLPFDLSVIENDYSGRIYCEKASSGSKNAKEFDLRLDKLTLEILDRAGLIKDEKDDDIKEQVKNETDTESELLSSLESLDDKTQVDDLSLDLLKSLEESEKKENSTSDFDDFDDFDASGLGENKE